VQDFLECVITSLRGVVYGGVRFKPSRLKLREGADITSLQNDYWLLLERERVVGCVKVDREGERRIGATALDKPRVLNAMYDYLRTLESLHGTRRMIGIVTSHNHWRVCWLGDAQSESASADRANCVPTRGNLLVGAAPDAKENAGFTENASLLKSASKAIESEHKAERVLSVSKILRCDNADELLACVGGALLRMYFAPSSGKIDLKALAGHVDAGSDMAQRSLVFFTRAIPYRSYGVLPGLFPGLQVEQANTELPQEVFVVGDLGRGRDGRVSLVCSAGGFLSVFKFVKSENKARKEAENLRRAYGERFAVRSEQWVGQWTVVMPQFRQFRTPEKRLKHLGKVEETLRVSFAEKGLEHCDVAWRNVGYCRGEDGAKVFVMLDLSDVRESTATEWVAEAVENLREGAL
jgi:hypothetical protein